MTTLDPQSLLERAGTILHISEIQRPSRQFGNQVSVRVLGRLVDFDPIHNLALIEHRGASLAIDAALLGPFHHRIKALLQFIGEVERNWTPPETLPFQLGPGAHHPILRARIARNVDGLDVPLYEQALEIRRRLDIKRAAQEV
ncbi:hypothetical protein HDU89_003183 [Geranomyces variabilis]|nr:hypothetical protein HDU89_003183 [Geranomyces variabilis]